MCYITETERKEKVNAALMWIQSSQWEEDVHGALKVFLSISVLTHEVKYIYIYLFLPCTIWLLCTGLLALGQLCTPELNLPQKQKQPPGPCVWQTCPQRHTHLRNTTHYIDMRLLSTGRHVRFSADWRRRGSNPRPPEYQTTVVMFKVLTQWQQQVKLHRTHGVCDGSGVLMKFCFYASL